MRVCMITPRYPPNRCSVGDYTPAALQEGRNIVLVPPADAMALARAMVELADDPNWRRTLGEQARAAAGTFTWPAIAAQTEDLYRRVLSLSRMDIQ